MMKDIRCEAQGQMSQEGCGFLDACRGEIKQRRFTTVALAARSSPGRMVKSMSPKTLKEVERAIGSLTPQEVEELYVGLEQHFPQPMDSRVQSDLSAGNFDTGIQRALDDEKNGRLRPL